MSFPRPGDYVHANRLYTLSAQLASSRPLYEASVYPREELSLALANRCAASLQAGDAIAALADAEAVTKLKRAWPKGWFRKAKALVALGRHEDAREAVLLGLEFEPTNEVCLSPFPFFLFLLLPKSTHCSRPLPSFKEYDASCKWEGFWHDRSSATAKRIDRFRYVFVF
jgi:tetratricopeptide (TPR) repeat protein